MPLSSASGRRVRAGVLRTGGQCASPFGSVVTGSTPFGATSLGITHCGPASAGGLPRYEPAFGCPSRGNGASSHLPDKEFRYLRTVHSVTPTARLCECLCQCGPGRPGPSVSPRRSDHLFIRLNRRLLRIQRMPGVWSLRILPAGGSESPHRSICAARPLHRSSRP